MGCLELHHTRAEAELHPGGSRTPRDAPSAPPRARADGSLPWPPRPQTWLATGRQAKRKQVRISMVARTCETAKVRKEESKGHFTTSNITCMKSATLESPLLTYPPCSNHLGFPMALGTEACCCDFFYFFYFILGQECLFSLAVPI